jgi:competence protein ComEC
MLALYTKIRTALRAVLDAQHDRVILWVPVCMGLGVAWYFHLKTEPPWWLGISFCLIFAALALLLRRRPALRLLCIALGLFAFGVTLSQFRTYSARSPYLTRAISYCHVTGRIAEIDPTPKGSKLLLEDVTISKVAPKDTPERISITLRSYDPTLVTGQRVALAAGLFPPPDPALPGGFDFNRYFYFQGIGAVGYGMGKLDVTPLDAGGLRGWAEGWGIRFAEFRHRLTESIRSYFHEPAGAVAAAFITGEVRAIPDSVNDSMRIAGLYHLLAVSGMNLSVVAGLAFFGFRLLLALVPAIALRYPIKKWAAALALVASYAYLEVSGAPVSAERAFFMVSLVFVAILCDRDPMPMRSIAIAAFCILLYEPEAALTASFQLSFSATAALVASYEWGIHWFARKRASVEGFGLARVVFYFAAVMATALIAWCATEPFIIYHFNQFSSYSLIANTIAEPLVSFILMPLVIAGVLLMPLGLAWLAFSPMQYGVDLLLHIATWVAHLPHAMWIVPNPSDYGFTLAVLGGCWIYFSQTGWRWLGAFAVVFGMSTAFFYAPPDLLVSGDAKHIAVRTESGDLVMLRGRNTNLLAQEWARATINHDALEKAAVPMRCDALGCILTLRGHMVAMLTDPAALADDCRSVDIVIVNAPVAHSACPAPLLLDATALGTNGTAAVWFTGKRMIVKQVKPEQGARPWVMQ